MKNFYIPKECMSNLVVSLIAVVMLIGVAIIPAYLSRLKLAQKISDARYQLDEHENLLPLYQTLKKVPRASSAGIAGPAAKTGLKKADINSALLQVRDISHKASMTVVSVSPDLSSASGNAQSVPVTISLKGSFENFKTVLTGLGSLPFVENIENFSINRDPNERALDFNIRLLLAVS